MKRLLISHIDLDGFGAITLARHFNDYLEFSSYMAEDYGFETDEDKWNLVKTYDEVIVADLSFEKDKLDELRNMGIHVEIYDHHSKADWIAEDEHSVFDLERCGTKIFWEEYVKPRIGRYKPIIDEFVELVDTYDLWKQESPLWDKAKNLNSVLLGLKDWNESNSVYSANRFYDLFDRKVERLPSWQETRAEIDIIERANKREEEVYNKAKKSLQIRVDKRGKLFGVFTASSKISLVCSRILKDEPNLDYVVAFNTWGGLTGRISFRSKEDFNCNDIGVANGHDVAAGGQISVEDSFKFLENIKLAFVYNEDYTEENIFEEVEI